MLRALFILMSLSANTVWEVRTTGSDANGGAFVAGLGGTDYSQQNAAQASGANLTVDATTNTKVTSAVHTFVAADVGNVLQITAGAGWTIGFYQITSVTSGAAILDRSPAAVGTAGGTWAMGGALLSPAKAINNISTGNTVYLKNGTYPTSVSIAVPATCTIVGYSTVRGDLVTKTHLQASAGSISILTVSGTGQTLTLVNLEIDGNGQSSVNGVSTGGSQNNLNVEYCRVHACTVGINTGVQSPVFLLRSEIDNNSSDGVVFTGGCTPYYCYVHNNGGNGANGTGSGAGISAYWTIFAANGAAGLTARTASAFHSVFYGNASSGMNLAAFAGGISQVQNCVFYGNVGWGALTNGSWPTAHLGFSCAAGSNTSGNYSGAYVPDNSVTLTSDPFTNGAAGDFSLNSYGLGTLAKAGFPGVFPGGTTTGYVDIGAAQHPDPSAPTSPNTPTLTVTDNGDGTGATATIAGSSAGSTNNVDVASVAANGRLAWSTFSRVGDGTVELALTPGRYLATVSSTLNGLNSAPAPPSQFSASAAAGTRTVTPAGNFPVAQAGLAWLVASSTSFQNWVSAGTAAAALNHVTFEADDTEESGSTRPRAIVFPAPEGYEEEKVSLQEFRPHIRLWLSFEAYPSVEAETPRETRLWDERLEFANEVQAVLEDMKAIQGLSNPAGYPGTTLGQITFHSVRLIGGPDTVTEVRAEGPQGETSAYYWGVVFEVSVTG